MLLLAGPAGLIGGFVASVSIDVGAVGAASTLAVTQAVTGVLAGDVCIPVCPGALNAGLSLSPGVATADGSAIFRASNATAGALDPAALTYELIIIRPGNLRR